MVSDTEAIKAYLRILSIERGFDVDKDAVIREALRDLVAKETGTKPSEELNVAPTPDMSFLNAPGMEKVRAQIMAAARPAGDVAAADTT